MGTLHLRSELAICANNCLSSEPVLLQADRATRPGLQLYQQFGGRSPQTFLSQRHLTVFGAGMTGVSTAAASKTGHWWVGSMIATNLILALPNISALKFVARELFQRSR